MVRIFTSKRGELFDSKSRTCFGEGYYTLSLNDDSENLRIWQAGAQASERENRAAIVEITPHSKEIDEKKLRALVTGKRFPGSKDMTADYIDKLAALSMWKEKFPELFGELPKVVVKNEKRSIKKSVKDEKKEIKEV